MVSTHTDPIVRPRPPARPGPLLSGGIAVLVAATFIPLGYVVWAVVSTGPARIYELVVRPRVGELLINTAGLVLVTVPLCVLLGIGAAWLVERTDVPGAAVWRASLVTQEELSPDFSQRSRSQLNHTDGVWENGVTMGS